MWPRGNVAVWPSWPQIKSLRGHMAANKILAWPPPQTVIMMGHKGVLRVVIRLGYMG